MICINCFNTTTSVVNSRAHKKASTTWRRRHCSKCDTTFTTIERPSLNDARKVHYSDGSSRPFSVSKLSLSIAGAFAHNPEKAAYDSLWLAHTVETTLATEHTTISTEDIAAITHQTLKNFDELAALQYAAQHTLITSARRRGRPSVLPSDRVLKADESPSR